MLPVVAASMVLRILPTSAILGVLALPSLAVAAEEEPPAAWIADAATYRIELASAEGPVVVDAEYTLRALGSGGPASLVLLGPEAVVVDAPAASFASSAGLSVVVEGSGTRRVRLRALLPAASDGHARVPVLPAARQHLVVEAVGLDVTVAGATGGTLSAADALDLSWTPAASASPAVESVVVHAETATAAWLAEGMLQTRARVRWRVARGQAARFSLALEDLQDLQVSGPNVATWRRVPGGIEVEARAPVRGAMDVAIAGHRAVVPGTTTPIPAPRPLGVSRLDAWTVLGRSEEGDLLPGTGPEPVPARVVPAWARGLSETPAIAYWHGAAPLPVTPARLDAVPLPEAIAVEAGFEVADNEDGREWIRGTWRVRNDRRQYLRVRPPSGYAAITARIDGTPATLLDGGGGTLLVPLPRSVETVGGLLSFPVEIAFIGTTRPWSRRHTREHTAPAIDIPVQSAHWSLSLPRGFSAPTAARSAPSTPTPDHAREAVTRASSAYRQNRWDEAQAWLDVAKQDLAEDEDVRNLQSNLDVMSTTTAVDAPARRIKELAKAKSGGTADRLQRIAKEAKTSLAAGDYDKAEALATESANLALELSRTAQAEEQSEHRDAWELANRLLDEVADQRNERAVADGRDGETDASLPEEPQQIYFDGIEITGEGAGGGGSGGGYGYSSAFVGGVATPAPAAAPLPSPPRGGEGGAERRVRGRSAVAITVPTSRPLDVTASAFAAAMPVDGTVIEHRQALLPADQVPTFRFQVHPSSRGVR